MPVPASSTGRTVALAPEAPTIRSAISSHEPRSTGLLQVVARNRSAIRYSNAMKKMSPKGNVQLDQR